MKRLINNGDIFDKYVKLKEKDHRGNFDWYGHRHISGTYYGAAYNCSLADNYMANNLRSAANPTGSILQEAKNYVDGKVKEFKDQLNKEIKGSKNDIVSAEQEFNNHIKEKRQPFY